MQKEKWLNLINDITERKYDPDLDYTGKPRKNRPFGDCNPTVAPLLVVKPNAYPCEWCQRICSKEKTYSRSAHTNLWRAKCQDCGEKRNIHTSQINSDK